MVATDPPISNGALRRINLNLRKTVPTHGLGAHLRRHAGQSLLFREYRHYHVGDDIRLVDWAASRRSGQSRQKIVKSFEAQEQITLVLVVDDRATMRLPEGAEKLLLALWTARALAVIAAENGDRVVLAGLFSSLPPSIASGLKVRTAAHDFCENIWQKGSRDISRVPTARTRHLTKLLQPASAVVLVSDLLFEDPSGHVARFMQDAQKNWRDCHVVVIDSTEAELAQAARHGRILVQDTEGREFSQESYIPDERLLTDTRQRIKDHVDKLRRSWAGRGLVWHRPLVMPKEPTKAALEKLFIQHIGHLPVLHSIAARGIAR